MLYLIIAKIVGPTDTAMKSPNAKPAKIAENMGSMYNKNEISEDFENYLKV
jgi:hypothetical protein